MEAKTGVFHSVSKVARNGGGQKAQMMDEKVFQVVQAPLICTQAPGNVYQDSRTKRLYHTSVVENVVHFWRKGSSLLQAIDNVNYDAPREMYRMHQVWKALMTNIPGRSQQKRVYSGRRENLCSSC